MPCSRLAGAVTGVCDELTMFKKLWNSFQSDKPEQGGDAPPLFDQAKLKMLADFFPIGKKVRYYPEYQHDIVFPTIVLAYRINDHYLYSRDSVLTDDAGTPTAFLVEGAGMVPWNKVIKFQLLLPDTSDLERKLDYFTRAELGRHGQFQQGNTLSLMGDSVGRGVPTVDTRVERRQVMRSGPYADSSTVLTTLDFDTLGLADKRLKQRVQTHVSAGLHIAVDGPPFVCILGDFSDNALRLTVANPGEVMPPMTSNETVVVSFSLDGEGADYAIRCTVFRREDDYCVVNLDRIFKSGEFQKIHAMDIMEIKTGLLNRHAS